MNRKSLVGFLILFTTYGAHAAPAMNPLSDSLGGMLAMLTGPIAMAVSVLALMMGGVMVATGRFSSIIPCAMMALFPQVMKVLLATLGVDIPDNSGTSTFESLGATVSGTVSAVSQTVQSIARSSAAGYGLLALILVFGTGALMKWLPRKADRTAARRSWKQSSIDLEKA